MAVDDPEESQLFTLGQVARILGCTPETIRALEKRGRLPEGCEPSVDPASGTRYWTEDQVKRLKEWNDRRKPDQTPSTDRATSI